MIKKIRNYDESLKDSEVYKMIDSVCNRLLVFAGIALVIMSFAQQSQILNALGN